MAVAGCTGGGDGDGGNGNGNGDSDGSGSSPSNSGSDGFDEVELRVADTFPESHYLRQDGIVPWSEAVTERTNGQVTFEMNPAGQLGDPADMLNLVKAGTVDIAYVGPTYVSDQLPLSGVAVLPGTFDTALEGSEAYWEAVNGILYEEEISEHNVKPVLANVLPPYQLATNRKLHSMSDIETLNVRSGGGGQSSTISAIGATPVEIPAPDVYSSMEAGTIDSSVSPIPSIPAYDLDELLDYCTTNFHLGSFCVTWMMNGDVFGSLNSDTQEVINTVSEETVPKSGSRIDELNESTQDEIGDVMEFYESDAADAVSEAVQPVNNEWASDMDERGLAGTEVLEAWRSKFD